MIRKLCAPLLWTLVLGLSVIGCRGSKATSSEDIKTKLLGDWVVIADTAGQGHTGTLTLKVDGTFSLEYVAKDSKDFSSGTFKIGEFDSGRGVFKTVELTFKAIGDKPAPAVGTLRLMYDPGGNILHDFLTVAFARPNEVEQAKKIFERR